jgi:hypothetical protein
MATCGWAIFCAVGSTEVCGISAAKLATVVRIRLTPAATRAERTGSPMYAACKRAGRFWSTFAMTPGSSAEHSHSGSFCIRCRASPAYLDLYWLVRRYSGWQRPSAALICWPDCSVVTIVLMFRAIWISTGKSARAKLIHWVLQPVAISEIDNTIANRSGFRD